MPKTNSPEKLSNEFIKRTDARSSLSAYARYHLNLEPALHHLLICDTIDQLLTLEPDDPDYFDELIILAPPGSAKSTYTSVALPSYYVGRFPGKNILACSYSSELAEKWGRRARNDIMSPSFRLLFPETNIKKDSSAAGRWATTSKSEFYAAGVGSGILGFRADLALIDDPISGFEEAQSITQLQKVHGWYENDFMPRLKPHAKLILICQRLSPNDLAGYLIRRNAENPTRKQRILKLPMLVTPSNASEDSLKRPAYDASISGSDSYHSRLWPEWYTESMLADAQRDEFKWKTLYQQEPPSETGDWVSQDEFQIRPSPTSSPDGSLTIYGMTDLALSVNSGDYTVHQIVGISPNGDWDVLDVYRERTSPEKSCEALLSLTQTYHPVEWLIDDDNASKVFINLIASIGREKDIFCPIKKMPMRGQNKEVKNAALRGQFKRKKVWFPPNQTFTPICRSEVLAFPNAVGQGVDDTVDCLGLLGRRLSMISQPYVPTLPPKQPTVYEMCLEDLFQDYEATHQISHRI